MTLKIADTLTPALSRMREREQKLAPTLLGSIPRAREKEKESASTLSDPLARERERVGVRVRARTLRQGQTDAEALLWSKLRARQISGFKFRRQHPIGNYFADFACVEIGLVIELDGGQHSERAAMQHDEKRSNDMNIRGFQTLRFWNNDVLNQTDAVLEKIVQVANTLTPALSRMQEREQEHIKGSTP